MINTNVGCNSGTEALSAIIIWFGEYRGAGFFHFLFGHNRFATSFGTIFIVRFGTCLDFETRYSNVVNVHLITLQVGKTKVQVGALRAVSIICDENVK